MRAKTEASHGRFHAKGGFCMRRANTSGFLILTGLIGCYVQPYNPPPGQVGQAPPAQTAPAQPYDQSQPAPPQPGYTEQQPPPAPPPPPPAAPPSTPVYTGPTYDTVSVDVQGSNVPSVDV